MKKIFVLMFFMLSIFGSGLYAKDEKDSVNKSLQHTNLNKKIKSVSSKKIYNTTFIAKKNIILRDKPNRKGKIVKRLPKGSKIVIEYCEKNWCKIKGENLYTAKYAIKLLRKK